MGPLYNLYSLVASSTAVLRVTALEAGIPIIVKRGWDGPDHPVFKDAWSLHKVGLAIDVYPIIKYSTIQGMIQEIKNWDKWAELKDLAIKAGFDAPLWDYPTWSNELGHLQFLDGVSEDVLKFMFESSKGDMAAIHHYIDNHIEEKKKHVDVQ
jgi:hypothetical protein